MQLIDMHSHYITPYFRKTMERAGQLAADLVPLPPWDLELFIGEMAEAGITHSVISASSPNQSFGDKAIAMELTRECNESGAEYVKKYPERLSMAASLPFPYVEETLAEIKYAFDTLGARAVRILSNSVGVYPGSAETEAVFEELNRRKAVVILHPTYPQEFPKGTLSSLTVPLFEFFPETCRAVFNLILSGTLRRCPDIKVIVPHCGALIIPILERVEKLFNTYATGHEYANIEPANVLEDAATLYFDIAGDPFPRQLDNLLTFADKSHVLYGTDFPWNAAGNVKHLVMKLTEQYRERGINDLIFYQNALALFPMDF